MYYCCTFAIQNNVFSFFGLINWVSSQEHSKQDVLDVYNTMIMEQTRH